MPCQELIGQKDRLIADFQKQLKGKDDAYVRSLRGQTADIDTVLSYMDQEVGRGTEGLGVACRLTS